MIYFKKILLSGLFLAMAVSTLLAQESLDDPYVILNRHFDAVGGLDRLKAERSHYLEGNVSVAGLQGTLKVWMEKPDRSRIDLDLGVFKMLQGDNGEYNWVVDTNGKLQKTTNPDENAIKRKEVKRRMAEYEYADPGSEVFDLIFEGTDDIEGKSCYIIKMENNINDDYTVYYISTGNFLLVQKISGEGSDSHDSFYKDYRDVEGIKIPFWEKVIAHETGQVEEIEITEYVSNPDIDPSLFDAPEEGAKDYRFTEGDRSENIPFKFEGNHLYIPVSIDCRERYWILDTGASVSVITEEYATELGLDLQGDMKGSAVGGTVDIKFATLPPFSMQGIEFDEQTVAVINLKELNRMLAVEVVGILGFDFLSRFVTKVDYANELVSFYEPETFEYAGGGREIDVHVKDNLFMIKATLEDNYSGTWLFDIGASSINLNGVYALKNRFTERKGVLGMGRGAGSSFYNKKVKCEKIDFAGYTLDNPTISFSYGGTDTVFTADNIGILGNTLFRNFVVYCDYLNERVILEKGDNFNREFPADHSGLQIIRGKKDGYEIMYVSEDTPADKAGFQEGDILRSINEVDVEYFGGLTAIRHMLRNEPGTKYFFVVDRGGKEKKINIKLADLL
jgi:hypothetical protein